MKASSRRCLCDAQDTVSIVNIDSKRCANAVLLCHVFPSRPKEQDEWLFYMLNIVFLFASRDAGDTYLNMRTLCRASTWRAKVQISTVAIVCW